MKTPPFRTVISCCHLRVGYQDLVEFILREFGSYLTDKFKINLVVLMKCDDLEAERTPQCLLMQESLMSVRSHLKLRCVSQT